MECPGTRLILLGGGVVGVSGWGREGVFEHICKVQLRQLSNAVLDSASSAVVGGRQKPR